MKSYINFLLDKITHKASGFNNISLYKYLVFCKNNIINYEITLVAQYLHILTLVNYEGDLD
jgi:hypothetical protein